MSVKLLNLRQVPDDELDDICKLLDDHDIGYYETSAGVFGISLPALWLREEAQLTTARELLDRYAGQREQAAKAHWQAELAAGRQRTWLMMWRERPLQMAGGLLLVFGLVYLSTVPWFF